MALTKTAGWSLGTAGLCVALTAGSWFALVEPQRAEAAELREQTVAASSANADLQSRIDQLELEFVKRPERDAELAAIRQALPEQPALAQLVREVAAAGTDTGVRINSIAPGTATAVVDEAAAVVATEAPADGAEPAPSAEPTPAPSADASSEAGAEGSGATPVPGAPAGTVLASLPVTVDITGDFGASVLFLKQLQADLQRALLVDGVGMVVVEPVEAVAATDEAPAVAEIPPGTVTTSITARIFVFVDGQDAAAAVVAPTTPTTPVP